MGRGMLKDSHSLNDSKLPSFVTHPTPVNVSVLRKTSLSAPVTATGTTNPLIFNHFVFTQT